MLKRAAALALCLMLFTACALADPVSMAGYDAIDTHNWNNNRALERLEDRSGITFTYHQYTDEAEWKAAKEGMNAQSSDLPEVLFKAELTQKEVRDLYAKGVLIDLKPYLAEYAPTLSALLKEHPEWEAAITLPDGAIVALPNINQLQNNNAIWINTQWLKKLGLQMPTTADELTEVLRAFKTRDPNGNGRQDEVPLTFTGMWDLRWLAHAFGIYSNDYYLVAEDGVVRQTLTSQENREFLTWAHQLYTEGLIDRNGFFSSESARQITDANAAVTYGMVLGPSILHLLPVNQMENYKVMMPLVYNGRQVFRQLLNDLTLGTFALTKACNDPAAMVAWVDFLYTEEGCYLTQAGLKDKEYEIYSDGTWHWVDTPAVVTETIIPDYTIASGSAIPGYMPASYQMNYDDAQTQTAVRQLAELQSFSRYPVPLVSLSDDAAKQAARIWNSLGEFAESTMARFVAGDYPLTDDRWNEFCQEAERRGLSELVSIWQAALN